MARRSTVIAAAALALLSALVVTACGGGAVAEPDEVPFVRINTQGTTPAPDADYVARNDAEWQLVWNTYHAGPNPLPTRPAVDFSQRMVVGLSRAGGPACGSLRVMAVREEAMRVRVTWAYHTPPPGTVCAAVALPFGDFVSLPRVNKQVLFVEGTP